MADLMQLPLLPDEAGGRTSLGARIWSILNPNPAMSRRSAQKRVPAPKPRHAGLRSGLKYDEFGAFLSSVLLDMPSIFERLTYLAELNKSENQARLYGDLSRRFPEWGADQNRAHAAVEWQHEVIFEKWLCLTLEEKLADLDEWASQFRTSRAELARQWRQPRAIHDLEPESAEAPEIALFRSDLKLLLQVILGWER